MANYITNGTFDTTLTGWSTYGTGTYEVVSGRAKMTMTSGGDSYIYLYQQIIGLTAGQTYTISIDWESDASYIDMRLGSDFNTWDIKRSGYIGPGASTWVWTFTALTTNWITLMLADAVGKYVYWDNVSIPIAVTLSSRRRVIVN